MTTLRRTLIGLAWCCALAGFLPTAHAIAIDYTVCLRLPVTLEDETGQANELGTSGNWIARGIWIDRVVAPNGVQVAGFPKYANAGSGCFSFTSSQSGEFSIGIQPRGQLAAGNELVLVNDEDQSFIYIAHFDLTAGSGTYVWPYERKLPRMYAVFAYAIQSGFRGNYDDEELRVHYDIGPCACNHFCGGDPQHIVICAGSSNNKFVMAHEYGHANIHATTSFKPTSACGGGHGMRGLEANSCAAMEGWADFVATEVWNQQSGVAPAGWLTYWKTGLPVIDVQGSQGGCASDSQDITNFRSQYADHCFDCPGGDCSGEGTELDWMRTWWDFYSHGDLPGTPLSPAQLQQFIDGAGNWDSDTAWQTLLDGASGDQHDRFLQAGNWNGTSEP